MVPFRSAARATAMLALAVPSLAQKPDEPKPPTQSQRAYDEALERYRTCLGRLPLTYHTEGRTRLANTRTPEALRLLCADYQKPKDYAEFARYSLARLLVANFGGAAAVPAFASLREACNKPVDTWMWVKTLRVHADHQSGMEVVEIATTSKNLLHRAAAILALGDARAGDLKTPIVTNCVEWPKKESDRSLLLGAMSGALHANKSRLADEGYRAALAAYIGLLAPDLGMNHAQKLQIARHLQLILGGPALFENPEPWLELLQHRDARPKAPQTTTAKPRFFGIETDGERFCYVVDMSDSMCKEIAPSARPAAVLTGPRKRPKGTMPDESDLPWHKIRTRWDLAREHLRISLQRLTPDKHFCVVWFGTDSGTLDACRGMVKATKANVDKVLAELEAIQQGPADPDKAPDGQLRGRTNLHGGLRHALSLTEKGFVDQVAYVDPAVLADGCDTVFLLSDGAPSWDEFGIEDVNYRDRQTVVDTEYNKPAAPQPRTTYYGPYNEDDWLLEDFDRMNAFRRIRLHCIGLGEANLALLKRLAQRGHGETYEFGRRTEANKDAGGK